MDQDGGKIPSRRLRLLGGIFVIAAGLGIALMGGATFFALRSILRDTVELYEMYEGMGGAQAGGMSPGQIRIFCVVAAVILVLGIIVTIAGIVQTVSLYRGRKKPKQE